MLVLTSTLTAWRIRLATGRAAHGAAYLFQFRCTLCADGIE